MKRFRLVLMILFLAAALIIVGVSMFGGAKTPEEILTAVLKNMDEIGSMRFQMNLGMEVSVLEQAVSLHSSVDGELTANPAVVHATVKTEMSGAQPTETEVYLETAGNETVTYMETGMGSWTAQRTQTSPELASGAAGVLKLATVFAETEPEAVSETECVLTGEIPANKVVLALQATGMLLQLQTAELLDRSALEEMTEYLEAIPVRILVDTEKRLITGYELDLTGTMRAILTAAVQTGLDEAGLNFSARNVLDVTQVTAGVRFSAFDEVEEIVIPEFVKK